MNKGYEYTVRVKTSYGEMLDLIVIAVTGHEACQRVMDSEIKCVIYSFTCGKPAFAEGHIQ